MTGNHVRKIWLGDFSRGAAAAAANRLPDHLARPRANNANGRGGGGAPAAARRRRPGVLLIALSCFAVATFSLTLLSSHAHLSNHVGRPRSSSANSAEGGSGSGKSNRGSWVRTHFGWLWGCGSCWYAVSNTDDTLKGYLTFTLPHLTAATNTQHPVHTPPTLTVAHPPFPPPARTPTATTPASPSAAAAAAATSSWSSASTTQGRARSRGC
jgi:hypothetical protein